MHRQSLGTETSRPRTTVNRSLSFIIIRGTKGGGQTGDDLGNQPVQIGVGWTLDVQVPAANIVECLVVLRVSFDFAASIHCRLKMFKNVSVC